MIGVTKILVREKLVFPENFGPAMDHFSMGYWSGGPIFSGNIGPGSILDGIMVLSSKI